MIRILSFVALSTLLFATAVNAYSGKVHDGDGYRVATDQHPIGVNRLVGPTEGADAADMHGDNCGVDGYPWIGADEQPIEG